MPEICRFFGIVIRMFSEATVRHHAPHFHAYYQDSIAVFSIDPVELLEGTLPARQKRLVEAWAELHQNELTSDWDALQAGRKPTSIAPLQ